MNENIDIRDLESFINGLQVSLDMLAGADPSESKGFQAQLAKTISNLRIKRVERYLDTQEYPKGKYALVKKIVHLRAEINRM